MSIGDFPGRIRGRIGGSWVMIDWTYTGWDTEDVDVEHLSLGLVKRRVNHVWK